MPLRSLLPTIPDVVERVIRQMMEPDPDARFQSAAMAGRALSEAHAQLLNAATQEIVLPLATEEISLDTISSDALSTDSLSPDDDVTTRFE